MHIAKQIAGDNCIIYGYYWQDSYQLRWKSIIVCFPICNIIAVYDCHSFNMINIYWYRHICFPSPRGLITHQIYCY